MHLLGVKGLIGQSGDRGSPGFDGIYGVKGHSGEPGTPGPPGTTVSIVKTDHVECPVLFFWIWIFIKFTFFQVLMDYRVSQETRAVKAGQVNRDSQEHMESKANLDKKVCSNYMIYLQFN